MALLPTSQIGAWGTYSSLLDLACLLVLPWGQYLWTYQTSLVGTAEPIAECAKPNQPDCLLWLV